MHQVRIGAHMHVCAASFVFQLLTPLYRYFSLCRCAGTSLYTVSQMCKFLLYHDLDSESEVLRRAFDSWREQHGFELADSSSSDESDTGRGGKKARFKAESSSTAPRNKPKHKKRREVESEEEYDQGEDEDDEDEDEDEDEEINSLTHTHTQPVPIVKTHSSHRGRAKEATSYEDGDADEETDTLHYSEAAHSLPPPTTDHAHSYCGHRRQRSHSNRFSRGQWTAGVVGIAAPDLSDAPYSEHSFSAPAPRLGSGAGWERYHQRMGSVVGWSSNSGAGSFGSGTGSGAGAGLGFGTHLRLAPGHQRDASLMPSGLELEALQAREARMWAESTYQTHAPAPLPINPITKLVMSPMSASGQYAHVSARNLMSPTSPLMGQPSLSPFQGMLSPTDGASTGAWPTATTNSATGGSTWPPTNTAISVNTAQQQSTVYKRPRLASPISSAASYAGASGLGGVGVGAGAASKNDVNEFADPSQSTSPARHVQMTTTTTTTTTLVPCQPDCQCSLHQSVLPPRHPSPTTTATHLASHVMAHARDQSMGQITAPPERRRSLSLPDASEFQKLSEKVASDILITLQHLKR
jgi:hypothetical protein